MDESMTENQSQESALPSSLDENLNGSTLSADGMSMHLSDRSTEVSDAQMPALSDDFVETADPDETAGNIEVVEEDRRRSFRGEAAALSGADVETAQNTHIVASAPVEDPPQMKERIQDAVASMGLEEPNLRTELESVKERLDLLEKFVFAPPSEASMIEGLDRDQASGHNSETAVSAARSKEAAGLAEDQKALSRYQQELRYWRDATATFQRDIQETVEKADISLAAATEAKESLRSTVQEQLQGRHQGLELIGKMLKRLPERASSLVNPSITEETLKSCTDADWRQAVIGDTDGKKVEAKLRLLETERYQQVTQARDRADGQRKQLLGFLEKQVLPILDALDEGEKLSQPFRTSADASTTPPDVGANLVSWFGTYSSIRADLLALALKMDVQPMTVEIGEMIDYTRHEPFDVVQDAALSTEAVKEETRKGYECRLPGEDAPLVLRAAQVVVVKN